MIQGQGASLRENVEQIGEMAEALESNMRFVGHLEFCLKNYPNDFLRAS